MIKRSPEFAVDWQSIWALIPRLLRWIFVLTAEVTAPIYILMSIYLDEEPVEQPL
jgi:phage shock protein PspC (stress-responsive transcriptional regulator)